ncbi:hypothetical protein [Rummeliibacillus pycnus]|uniref:hypothetical protein n=1 Tax=Rummeliibacillus pycnus TaxID=101070 RepID=UPI003D2B57AA
MKLNNNQYTLNSKVLPVPSFFSISNLGGGGSDKYRETVYGDILENTPILLNFFYLNQKKIFGLNGFAVPWLSNIDSYDTFGDFLNYVRQDMINSSKYISSYHTPDALDYNNNILLLDSGAGNIINNIHLEYDYITEKDKFIERLLEVMKNYYDFADRFKFDIVIGFDIGGKYTFKGDERSPAIKELNMHILRDADDLNKILLDETIKYLKNKDEFYPKVFATIHGKNPIAYKTYTQHVLSMEKKYDFTFDGFAGGGIASAKNAELRRAWGISSNVETEIIAINKKNKNELYNAILSSYACKIIRKTINDNRPIHALGCGGKFNILPLYYAGATSFDAQTPGRRAYDGSAENNLNVKNPNAAGTFSKYMVAGLSSKLKASNNSRVFEYLKLPLVDNTTQLCGCPACILTGNINSLKSLYTKVSPRNKQTEDSYYAKQLINIHGIWQHNYLSRLAQVTPSVSEIIDEFSNHTTFVNSLDYVINKFNYVL